MLSSTPQADRAIAMTPVVPRNSQRRANKNNKAKAKAKAKAKVQLRKQTTTKRPTSKATSASARPRELPLGLVTGPSFPECGELGSSCSMPVFPIPRDFGFGASPPLQMAHATSQQEAHCEPPPPCPDCPYCAAMDTECNYCAMPLLGPLDGNENQLFGYIQELGFDFGA